jgi:hypothetical protein
MSFYENFKDILSKKKQLCDIIENHFGNSKSEIIHLPEDELVIAIKPDSKEKEVFITVEKNNMCEAYSQDPTLEEKGNLFIKELKRDYKIQQILDSK